MYTHTQQGGGLPVPADYVLDQRTLDPGLPASNQVVLDVDAPPHLQRDIPFMIGLLRANAQNRLDRSGLHIFLHNLWSQNFYHNDIFGLKVQQTVDAVEYYTTVRSFPLRQAVEQATTDVYLLGLVSAGGEYPVLFQSLPPTTQQDMVNASHTTEQFYRTLQSFVQQKQHGTGVVGHQGGHGGHMAPGPVPGSGHPQHGAHMVHGGHPHQGHHVPQQPMGNRYSPGQMAVGGHAQPGGPASPAPAGSGSPAGRGGRYAEPPQASEWSSENPQVRPTQQPQEPTTMSPHYQNDSLEKPVKSIKDLVLDPYHYVPQGVTISNDRPWDHFYAPGGVEIQPAHQSSWKWTQGSDDHHPTAFDPLSQMAFLVKFPDGAVKEWIVERVESMDYLAHELVGHLRTSKLQRRRSQDGLVVPDVTNHAVYRTRPEGVDDVKERLEAGDVQTTNLPPIVIEEPYTASSTLENEEAVREDIADQLGLTEDDPLPAHIYPTATVYPLHVVSNTARNTLMAFTTADTLPLLADAMVEALNDETVSSRYVRFLNERLTRMVNQCLVDNFAITSVDIDSFIEDIAELYDYLDDKFGPATVEVFNSKTPSLLKRWLTFTTQEITDGDTTREEFCLVDHQINYQTAFEYAEIAALHLTDIPSVVDRGTHPNLYNLAMVLLSTTQDIYGDDNANARAYRLISVDGVYLQLTRSWFDNNTLLIKRLDF